MRECGLRGREQARLLRVQHTIVQLRREDIDVVVYRLERGAARAAMQRQGGVACGPLKICRRVGHLPRRVGGRNGGLCEYATRRGYSQDTRRTGLMQARKGWAGGSGGVRAGMC